MPRRPVAIPPRMLTAEQAAAYLGYATTALLQSIPVKPRRLIDKGPGSMPKYDRAELDAWLDRLAGLSTPGGDNDPAEAPDDAEASFSDWKARHGH